MANSQDRINGLLGDLGVKAPVQVATTAAITLYGEQTIDGVSVVAEDRVLVKNQSDQTANGIYYCQATAWVRAPDFDGVRDCLQGTLIVVATGTVNAGTLWRLTTASPVIGTSNLAFSLFPISASVFMQSVLSAVDAATARATLGSAALAGLASQNFATLALTASGLITPSQTIGIAGTTTNNSVQAGSIGEVISSSVPSGSAVSLVSATGKTITSISPTAGAWLMFGNVNFLGTSTTSVSQINGSSSATNNTGDSTYGFANLSAAFVPGAIFVMGEAIPMRYLSLASTTPYYLVGSGVFSASTLSAYGNITAIRIR